MLLLFYAIVIIILLIIIVIFSDIRLVVKNFQYSNIYKTKENKGEFKIQIYLLGKIKCLSIKIKNNQLKSKTNNKVIEYLKRRIEETLPNPSKKSIQKFNFKHTRNVIKYLYQNTEIKQLNTEILLGTKSVELTSIIVGVISTIIPTIIKNNIKKYNKHTIEKYYFKIIPIYKNIDTFNIKLNCIFSIKIVHIINMLKLQIEKEICKNERPSNRRFNANCNGKYKKYDRC